MISPGFLCKISSKFQKKTLRNQLEFSYGNLMASILNSVVTRHRSLLFPMFQENSCIEQVIHHKRYYKNVARLGLAVRRKLVRFYYNDQQRANNTLIG
jgi:hypothetical protein